MFKKILIANRGEIAVRIIRTCREMGIETVSVYSSADEKALHVIESDESVFLGDAEPSQSYLNIEKILNAAKAANAEAIHPGYGFLAENHLFAERCAEDGLVFIGPPAKVIRDLGSKTTARRIMAQAGVPVIPGMTMRSRDPDLMAVEAEKIGYPVLIKAVAGGGGKGMREVSEPSVFKEACLAAEREAEKAFGDGSLYLEKRLCRPRHVEFQIIADASGKVLHLFERECSIQRRHQKIIEESPCAVLSQSLREEMGKAAVTAAKAAGYVNAGTVEFLLDPSGAYYFLEVNTRLQVEHPVTEAVTGLDLVRLQIEIAAGNPIPFEQEEILQRGHAIECRIYAEDPENDFLPCPGRVLLHEQPSGPGVRNDCGIYRGFEVPVEYDPILSKLIAFGPHREAARTRMIRALEDYAIAGIKTTIPFLLDVLSSESFIKSETFTDFIDLHFKGWRQNEGEALDLAMIAHAANLILPPAFKAGGKSLPEDLASPWRTLGAWRL